MRDSSTPLATAAADAVVARTASNIVFANLIPYEDYVGRKREKVKGLEVKTGNVQSDWCGVEVGKQGGRDGYLSARAWVYRSGISRHRMSVLRMVNMFQVAFAWVSRPFDILLGSPVTKKTRIYEFAYRLLALP